MLRLGRAYANRQLEPYSQVFTQDFRFLFAEPELRARHPNGFTRADEIASADHLFHGFTDASGAYHPAAGLIEVHLDSLFIVPDSERAGSPDAYAVVVVPATSLHIVLENEDVIDIPPRCHVIHCVRGDEAQLDPDQPADLDHWYVRRWDELEDGAITALGTKARGSGLEPSAPLRLSVRAAPNPVRHGVAVLLALPTRRRASLEVLDVAGRRVIRNDLGELSPGIHRLALDTAEELAAGVYWLRASQGRESAVSRLVVAR